ncbi:hypothetical protein ADIARSV_3711 [Arcticibacter svalbardensis MN12-7]|uniref:Tetratricopeptide repeat protein n=1 Tax=Arcticibacter svalbardensis MN12-7 TaxID=1150600 RepID=R9GN90_9SPHI|nr:hypothetical protein [Arcticibacter svalbardensis]EOR93146.1 hypothetical protein ADIARSV_3711 [Arcticibacter svalbardensis MN12-7]
MNIIRRAIQASLLLGVVGTTAFAQSLGDAKKAIDAEQYQQAKTILKKLIASQPTSGENYFYLGNVYLKDDYTDSAKATFNKGVSSDAEYALNYVGLGTLDLGAKNPTAAKAKFDKAISLVKRKDNSPYLYIGKAYTNAVPADYASALANLTKAKEINEKDAEVYLAMGDAYRGDKKNSEAFGAYRTAYDMDKTLLRAEIEQGKLIKQSKAFQESADKFKSILAINAKYAPAYRELAETYYLWAKSEPQQYDARIKEALQYYTKYLDLTDRSLESRMRYADFLVLAGEYKSLEAEAQQMIQMDKANPRIYRYLGYSLYENGNYAGSVQAMKDFMSKVDPERIIANDYLYLGKAQLKAGDSTGVVNLTKAVDIDSAYAEPISELAKTEFSARKYGLSAELYELAVKNAASKTYLFDYFYLGMANYFDYASKTPAVQKTSKEALVRADSAFSLVSQKSPSTADAYLYRARTNRLLDDDQNSKGLMVPHFEKYIEIILAKPDGLTDVRNKKNLVESYNNLGAYFLKTDQAKSKELFNKAIALDPTNEYALSVLNTLK